MQPEERFTQRATRQWFLDLADHIGDAHSRVPLHDDNLRLGLDILRDASRVAVGLNNTDGTEPDHSYVSSRIADLRLDLSRVAFIDGGDGPSRTRE